MMLSGRSSIVFPVFLLLFSGLSLLLGGCAHQAGSLQADARGGAVAGPGSNTLQPVKKGKGYKLQGLSLQDRASIPNLWQRIAAGFAITPSGDERVEQAISWYQRHPGFMATISRRAEPYLFHIVTSVERRGMPAEVALLPIIESAFRPAAWSSQGAAGLWQLMGPTAKRFGVTSSWWYDGRRDVKASTRAALDYLDYLHKYFDGDWLLALAAYNSGENRVRRAVARNREQGLPADYWHLDLPPETQGYLPKLMAIRRMLADPEHFGIELPVIANKASTRWVNIGQQLELSVAARLASTSVDEIKALNPGLTRWASDPDGPHYLMVRADQAVQFAHNLRKLSTQQRVTWCRYQVAKGDALSLIARSFGTSTEVLRKSNHLSSDRIRIGQTLLVPAGLVPAGQRTVEGVTLAIARSSGAGESKKPGKHLVRYTVKEGDNLWSISRRFGVSHKYLARWNSMQTGDALPIGKVLLVMPGGESTQGV